MGVFFLASFSLFISILQTIGGESLFSVSVSEKQINEKCVKIISLTKKNSQIRDTIPIPCERSTEPIIIKADLLVVGSVIHSTKPDSIVVIRGDKCVQRSYPLGQGSPSIQVLDHETCVATKEAVSNAGGELVTDWGRADEADDLPNIKEEDKDESDGEVSDEEASKDAVSNNHPPPPTIVIVRQATQWESVKKFINKYLFSGISGW